MGTNVEQGEAANPPELNIEFLKSQGYELVRDFAPDYHKVVDAQLTFDQAMATFRARGDVETVKGSWYFRGNELRYGLFVIFCEPQPTPHASLRLGGVAIGQPPPPRY